jgi:hypothetical protein
MQQNKKDTIDQLYEVMGITPTTEEEIHQMNLRALARLEAQRRGESVPKYPGTVVPFRRHFPTGERRDRILDQTKRMLGEWE